MGNTLGDFVSRLRGVAAVQTLGGLPDRDLLGRFVESNDESAFSVLVERHGAMVLAVCRRLLPLHGAEDACQAVFLVLARKASSLRKQESLGCWLRGVARRVSANARRDAELRKARETGAAMSTPRNPVEEAGWHEVLAALDEEIGRLPEAYRAPLVLCYLEHLTRDEAAARLGLSVGALHGRLERGRTMLRDRLSKRGLSLPAVLTAVSLGEGSLPPLLAVSTANAAVLFAAGQPLSEAVGANVLALTREVLMSMSMTKVKVCTAVAVCAAVVAALVGGAFLPVVSAQDKRPGAADHPTQNQQGATDGFTNAALAAANLETDETFIRRISKDLRESDPTPAEVHFFVASKDPGKRQKLIDLFVEERKARREAMQKAVAQRDEEEGQWQVFSLKHASSVEMARLMDQLVGKKGARVVAEERSNRVLVRANKEDMNSIRKLVEALDTLAGSKEKEEVPESKK
jgi:RNA polymerase sigma factor (sigma-70 family)